MDYFKRIKKLKYLIAFAIFFGVAIFVLRGPYISNALKKIILPELENATGRSVIASKIYVNIFPLFVEIKGLKVFDENGEKILLAKRLKGYIDLSGLLNRKIVIRRLVIKDHEITTSSEQMSEIIGNVKTYLDKERDTALKVKVLAVEMQQGSVSLYDDNTKSLSEITGLNGEIILGKSQRIKASAGRIKIKKEGWPEITGDADLSLTLIDKAILINRLIIGSSGSKITGSGEYSEDKGNLRTDIELLVKTVKELFDLGSSGDGKINAKGNISYAGKEISLDLKLAGKFYIQTLMELLEVEERVEGLVEVKGDIKGPLKNLRGSGTATLHNGNLFDVDVDSLTCGVSYADGTMRFSDGDGRLYNGYAKVSASIKLPVVNFFTIDIEFADADSKPVFKLIGWDPGIQPGKVKGILKTSGAEFNPEGWFEYKSTSKGKDVLGRVSDITGKYTLNGSLLTLADLKINTGRSEMSFNGLADVDKETLNFEGTVKTGDVNDVSSPYYEMLKGTGEFAGKIKGSFGDPVISGRIKLYNPVIEGYIADSTDADVIYKRDLLNIREILVKGKGETHKLNGNIYFKNAKELFDLSAPEYKLTVSLDNADLERFAKVFYPEFIGTGRLSSDLKITGTGERPEVNGDAVVEKANVYKVPFDSASFGFRYAEKKLNFAGMRIKRGKSVINGDATIDSKGIFSYKAASDKLMLSDIVRRDMTGDAVFSLKTEGYGTFENPSIILNARMIGGTMKGRSVGSGIINASIKDKDISIKASMINDKINVNAKGRLENEIPWDAKIEIQTGRYDFLVNPFLKEIPEDLILSLNGTVLLKGDKKHIEGSSVIKHLVLSMYGYSFSNEEEIRLNLNDRQLSMNRISMRSGSTSLRINGGMVIGRQYDIVLEGNSALSPFKSLSSKIGVLKGDASLVVSITGDWESPLINGGLNLSNGSVGLKDYHYIISSLNGYLYMDGNRIVLQKLSGKIGGGDIEISGILLLKKFSFKRFYVESRLNNITASVSNDFNVNFGGNILYKGTLDSQMVSGDIKINRARYKERVEWKSWLLKTKKTEKFKTEISNLEKAELNIRVTGKDNIFIDNNVARATVSADMVLKGTIYRPVLLGRLETKDGTVYFRNNEFRIIHASADFADHNRINPVMEITSETNVRGYKIKMNLEGQLDRFNMSLSSSPPLKEIDILSLLTVGQTGGEMKGKGLEGGIGAGEATSFVTGKLQDVIEERLKSITGLDRFQVDPYVSKITGTVEPRVTVSKRLLGDKMFVTYTTTLGSKEEQIIKLEYFLGKNMSLVGLRDERGIVGGDIRFRFEFK